MVILALTLTLPARADTNAVDRGLRWLVSQQQENGSWSTNSAIQALAMLAFLSAGHVPSAEPYGPALEKGLQYVLSQQGADGSFMAGRGMMYGHGMTTLLLAEVSGMSKQQAKVKPALAKAVELILRSQAVEKGAIHAGGWRYWADSSDSDLSVTIWQMLALKAASDVGVPVPRASMERAIGYVRSCQHLQGGFGYQPGGIPNEARTAGALVALRVCGVREGGDVERARAWLKERPLAVDTPWFYYAGLHMAHAGIGFSEPAVWREQRSDGSWLAPEKSTERTKGGPVYCTALAVMALTAKFNYLPAYLD
jgi:prenyltransferase beta subunit